MNHIIRCIVLPLSLLYISFSGNTAEVMLNVSGTVTVPPCTINNGQTIEVNFGNIVIPDISNSKYYKTTTVPVNCANYLGVPYVKIIGSQLSGADLNVLSTNINGYGIALYQGADISRPMTIGNGLANGQGEFIGYQIQTGLSGINVVDSSFTFTSVPYNNGSVELSAGTFSASASMSISYL